ncbi:YceH family protein [Desulfuromonas sp. AOP6]|uniref:YceH family protein n=1 Tax=Desulfuromonas sp. AOP6 TaxID=1566351 RepID=UPI00127152F6|nr:YceH family protein [Desulfuromonas sp. AOP6]BCA80796.1 UPF0502 protein [Desulfuromonas sp. AOP6]
MEQMLLDAVEARVLGCLLEKEMATPEYYPLSLNALTNACNQKTNREPVMALEETEVVRALERLRHGGLAMQSGEGGRVPKYRHTLAEKLHLEPEELAVLCVLLVRGPQTVGEVRGRSERLYSFGELAQVEEVLQGLEQRQPPLVSCLPRQPGRKESRYAHLFAGAPPEESACSEAPAEAATLRVRAEEERMVRLEDEVAALREEVETLRREMAAFKAQFD